MKDHVILHHLLTKMFEGKIKYQMCFAYHRIIFGKEKQSPIRVERAKKVRIVAMKTFVYSSETRNKMSKSHQGKTKTKETRKRMSMAKKGIQFSQEHVQNISEAKKGSKHPKTSLTDEIVLLIRKLYKTGQYTHEKLGYMFNLTKGGIAHIIHRRSWSHI